MLFSKKNLTEQSEVIEEQCPFCSHSVKLPALSYINAEKDQALKLEAMNNQLFHARCPVCGSQIPLSNFLAYEDKPNHSVLYFEPDAESRKNLIRTIRKRLQEKKRFAKQIRYRITTVRDDFYEKVRILDCGLDDRVVELMKLCIRHYFSSQKNRTIQKIRFHIQRDTPLFLIDLEEAHGFFGFSTTDYETLSDSLKEIQKEFAGFDECSIRVDQDWAARALLRIQEKFLDPSCLHTETDSEREDELLITPESHRFGA